jgi:simple sugar transport system permease protein
VAATVTAVSTLRRFVADALLPSAIGLLMGLTVAVGLGWVAGASPLAVLRALWQGAFGDRYAIAETLVKATPILMAGLGVAIAFRCGVWNIGAEGQLLVGALMATAVGTKANLPVGLHLAVALLMSALGGAMWAAIPAWLRVKRGVNEVVVTLLLNFVAAALVGAAVHSVLKESAGVLPQSDLLAPSAQLPALLPPTRLHAGFPLALLLAITLHFVLERTLWGFRLSAVGANPLAAETMGIATKKMMAIALLLSGALAGLAGAVEVCGVTHRLFEKFSPGYGYTAIVAALVARLNALGLIPSALLLGAINAGGMALQRLLGLSPALTWVIQAALLLPFALRWRSQ